MKKFIRIYLTLISMVPMMNSIVLASGSVEQIRGKLPDILNAVAWIGYAITFGMFIYIGIKYLMSAANERATLKQGSISFLIGGVMIASASVVANIVATVAAGGSKDSGGLAAELINTAQSAAGFTTGS